MRKAFHQAVLTADDPHVWVVSADQGYQAWNKYPRFTNAGISEQFAVDLALGMSKEGRLPVVYGIAAFITARAYEQIRYFAMQRLPALIVGVGGGYHYSADGPTHHAPDDLALMSLIPGMELRCPYDQTSARDCFEEWRTFPCLTYMRLEGAAVECLDWSVLDSTGRSGKKVSVITMGAIASEVIKAFRRIQGRPVDLHVLESPINLLYIEKKVIIAEDAGLLARLNGCEPDPYTFDFSHVTLEESRKARGLDADGILRRIDAALN